MTSATTSIRSDIPRAGVQGVAGGLLLMGFFTVLWGSWATAGVPLAAGIAISVVFFAFALAFIVNGILLFVAARRFPVVPTDERRAKTRNIGARFGIIFGIEGVLIGVMSAILGATGNDEYINGAIAVIVGLHFLPLAPVFDRTIDYYIGGWVVLAGIVGIVLIATGAVTVEQSWTIVSLATAGGTTVYGIYMLLEKRRLVSGARHS
ncbi:hypothetical protein [Leifsonia sp. NPDC058230]|uniref:hypothetical protein n=1 Tax=Leifsonia sp. NPDC058230 TaxID=3346391 RepID=UPI0036D87EC8